ncbi:TPA: hypothetical protein TUF52_000916 [Streptococcus equi subsp. zooepidemicus]|nr:hypothetical protein [Streptococcus equi subsp. zooepidemicus]
MQTFIANGRVADVPDDAVGQTAKGKSKEAANQRKLRQLNGTPSMENTDPYPQPMDVGEPF